MEIGRYIKLDDFTEISSIFWFIHYLFSVDFILNQEKTNDEKKNEEIDKAENQFKIEWIFQSNEGEHEVSFLHQYYIL